MEEIKKLIVTRPDLGIADDAKTITLMFKELSESTPQSPTNQPTGSAIHLRMTAQDSMRLLAALKWLQQRQNWPVPPIPEGAIVPPPQRRN